MTEEELVQLRGWEKDVAYTLARFDARAVGTGDDMAGHASLSFCSTACRGSVSLFERPAPFVKSGCFAFGHDGVKLR